MSLPLALRFNPSVPSAAAVADALAPVAAGADFLQTLQQWLARIQPPQTAPVSQPLAPAAEILASPEVRAPQQAGQEYGLISGGENAPLTLEMAEDALALLKHVLLGAGDAPAPGIGEALSPGVRPLADGEELPPGEFLPPDALATLSALSRQLERWLKQAGSDADAGNGEASGPVIHLAGSPPPPTLAGVLAEGSLLAPLQTANAPDGEEAAQDARRPFTAGLAVSLAGKSTADAVRPAAGEQAGPSRAAPQTADSRVSVPEAAPANGILVPLQAANAPDGEAAAQDVRRPFAAGLAVSLEGKSTADAARPAAGEQTGLSRAAPQTADSSATDSAAPGALPPPPAAPVFSAVLDEPIPPAAPQTVEAPPALPGAAPAAQTLAPNPPAATQERSAPPPVATPVGHPGWDAEMSQRVVWMSGNSVSRAEIHLNPPHLGPVEVRISLNQEQQTTVQFISPHAAVREALEAALPKLRAELGAQQLSLGDVSVSQQSAGQQSDSQQARGFQQQQQSSPWRAPEPEFSLDSGSGLPEEGERMRPVRTGQGLLNLYV